MIKFDNNVEEKIFYKIVKLRPESFLGLAKFFNIKILTEKVDKETKKAIPRSAEEITVDIKDKDTYGKGVLTSGIISTL